MFRRRAVTLFMVVGLLLVGMSWFVVRTLERNVRADAVARIGSARPGVARAMEHRALGQAFVASSVADSPLSVALDVLDDMRPDLATAAHGAEAAAAGLAPREALEQRQAFIAAFQRGGESLVGIVAERMANGIQDRWGNRGFGAAGRAGWLAAERTRLVQCLAVEVSQCFWDYSYVTLMEVLASTTRDWRLPVGHRIIVTDARGVGIADSRNDRWSNAEDFARTNELARTVRNSGKPGRDLVLLDGTWHLATAVPLVSGLRTVGTVIVADPFSRWMAREDAEALGLDVIFATGGKVVDTSAPPDVAQALVRSATALPAWVAAEMPLPGLPDGRDFKVLAALSLEGSRAAFATARLAILVAGLLLVVLGAVLLVAGIHHYDAGLESLYQGVHEVINGNHEYVFPTHQKDDVLRNLGTALNLMGMLAQGRPLVDEEADARPDAWTGTDSWESVDGAVHALERGTADSDEELAADGVDVAALAAEPAEAYYRRLYAEFMAARRQAGVGEEGVTQHAFMVRVVNLEQKLKKRYGVPMVRFVVSVKGSDVVLVPVRVRPPTTA